MSSPSERAQADRPVRHRLATALFLGCLGLVAAGWTRTAPGYTSDEPFNVLYGKTFVAQFLHKPWFVFDADAVSQVFGPRAEHPPLGRWLIGWINFLFDARWRDTNTFDLARARWAPALCYGLLVGLVSWAAGRYGKHALWAAGLLTLSMPRLFGHAHFAALEMPLTVSYALAVLALTAAVERGARPAWTVAAGAAAGVAMLTKIHGFLLLPVALLAFAPLGLKAAIRGTALYVLSAGCVWFGGWPWLWYDPVVRTAQFLSSGVARSTTYVTYFGSVYADKQVPWSYPWVMLAVTMPLPHLVLALAALAWHAVRFKQTRNSLPALAAVVVPLVLFSLPDVPVYDGIRLFLVVLPPLAWLTARWLQALAVRRPAGAAALLIVATIAGTHGMVRTAPCWLSYYSELVGGLPGAVRRGLQPTYWGDSVTAELLATWSTTAERGATLELVPTLYKQHPELYVVPRMVERAQRIVPQGEPADYTLVFRRPAYLPEQVRERAAGGPVVAELRIEGVWLTRIIRNRSTTDGARRRQAADALR